MSPRLIAGLGNPGSKYAETRHNVGFMVADGLAASADAPFERSRRWDCEVAKLCSALVVKPTTYMNLSGRAVAAAARFHKIDPGEILVVHDDADLPLGTLRFRMGGGAGGHNGIKSISQSFGTQDIPRLKLGIGRTAAAGPHAPPLADFVLGRFADEERSELEKMIGGAIEAVLHAIAEGLPSAMNQYNQSVDSSQEQKQTDNRPTPDRDGTPDPS